MNRDPQLNLTKAEVSQLDDFALCDTLWGLVVEAYNEQGAADWESAPCNYPESLFAKDLSIHWWVAYAVHAFEYDVLAGGFDDFFRNHAGLTNAETQAAFAHIGAHDYGVVFSDACAVFDKFKRLFRPEPSITDEDYNHLQARFAQEIAPTQERLWTLLKSRNTRSYLASYIRNNVELFQKH